MLTSRFYGLPHHHLAHKPWRLRLKSREAVRGAIRGAAARESLLHPSPAKAIQRRIRARLVATYVRRFGTDDFSLQFSGARLDAKRGSNWLAGGYAWWRERILSRKPQRNP